MPEVSIIVPYRAGDPDRDRAWGWVQRWWAEFYPQGQVITADSDGPWNKPQAVNRAVRAARGDVLVLADADVFLGDVAYLRLAVEAAQTEPWVMPHRMVLRLGSAATAEILSRAVSAPEPRKEFIRAPYPGFPGGGMVVCSRAAFEAVGGMDEAFEGWGGEDTAFACALDTLVGRHRRFGADLWHLYHHPGPRLRAPEYRANHHRANQYRRAMRDPARMRKLVGLPDLSPAPPVG